MRASEIQVGEYYAAQHGRGMRKVKVVDRWGVRCSVQFKSDSEDDVHARNIVCLWSEHVRKQAERKQAREKLQAAQESVAADMEMAQHLLGKQTEATVHSPSQPWWEEEDEVKARVTVNLPLADLVKMIRKLPEDAVQSLQEADILRLGIEITDLNKMLLALEESEGTDPLQMLGAERDKR
jgi:hypothetical protein